MAEPILGGARSGKRAHAEARARASGLAVTRVATAGAGDAEMRARIRHHRERRPRHWIALEAPSALADALRGAAAADRLLRIDCLTPWLGNRIEDAGALAHERDALLGPCRPCRPCPGKRCS